MTAPRQPMTIEQQADFLDYLLKRSNMADGRSGRAVLSIEPRDVEDLQGIISRLRKMAPHEEPIRRMVMGRRSR